MELMQTEKTEVLAAAKVGMEEKTAKKWVRLGKMPSEVAVGHRWRRSLFTTSAHAVCP